MEKPAIFVQHPRALDEEQLTAIGKRRTLARQEVSRVCANGFHTWQMTIPVDPRDSDVLICNSLSDSERLVDEIYRLREGIKRICIEHHPEMTEAIQDRLMNLLFKGDESDASSPQ